MTVTDVARVTLEAEPIAEKVAGGLGATSEEALTMARPPLIALRLYAANAVQAAVRVIGRNR